MESIENPDIQNNQVERAALRVALGGAISLIAGLASQIITAYLFGAGAVMDAYFTATIIPYYLQIVMLSGIPFVVIPAFIQKESEGKEEEAWSLAGEFLKISTIVMIVISIIGMIFSSQIITLIAPGFGDEKSRLASQMLMVLMFTVPFSSIATLTSGLENIRKRFFWPATATALGSVGNLLTLIILQPRFGFMALAWGGLVSSFFQALVTLVPVLKHGWKPTFRFNDQKMREFYRLISPFIFYGLITNSKSIFERYFASGLPDGQLSYIGYANKISNIFVVLLASGISAAIFPAMARSFSQNGMKGLVNQTIYGLKISIALALPAVAITSAVAVPMVQVLFERGAFTTDASLSVGIIVPIVMLRDVLFRMVLNMLGRTLYVLKDTLTTNLVNSVTLIVYVVLAIFLTRKLEYFGLTLALTIQSALIVIILSYLVIRKIKDFPVKDLGKSTFMYTMFSLLAAGVGWGTTALLSNLSVYLQLVAGVFVSILLYLALLWRFDFTVATSVFEMVGIQKIFTFLHISIPQHSKPNS